MNHRLQYLPGALLLVLGATPLIASIAIPHTFQSGETAVATEVNENFEALHDALNDALARIDDLETDLTVAQNDLAAVQGNNALDLHDYVEVIADPNFQNEYTVRFSGVNVQIVNGLEETETVNGLGNLIVGYNEARQSGVWVCSDGRYDNDTDCTSADETWAQNHKSGSHNIVGGLGSAYSGAGGLVVGLHNVINRHFATVSGGETNIASGLNSSVSGGWNNTASGEYSSVSGGRSNTASGGYSSASGGLDNTASGVYSSVSGGLINTASGGYSSVSGGLSNTASGGLSSVSGGESNTALGGYSSVSGGDTNTASHSFSSILGGDTQTTTASHETVPAIN